MQEEFGQGRDTGGGKQIATCANFTRKASSRLGDGKRDREKRSRERRK